MGAGAGSGCVVAGVGAGRRLGVLPPEFLGCASPVSRCAGPLLRIEGRPRGGFDVTGADEDEAEDVANDDGAVLDGAVCDGVDDEDDEDDGDDEDDEDDEEVDSNVAASDDTGGLADDDDDDGADRNDRDDDGGNDTDDDEGEDVADERGNDDDDDAVPAAADAADDPTPLEPLPLPLPPLPPTPLFPTTSWKGGSELGVAGVGAPPLLPPTVPVCCGSVRSLLSSCRSRFERLSDSLAGW